MLFNSVKYLLFLASFFVIYWSLSHKYRAYLILLGSYFFYMCWDAKYIVLIIGITLISYFGARIIAGEQSNIIRKTILVVTCIFCLVSLFCFKYWDFAIATINDLRKLMGLTDMSLHSISLVLPVGISFFTFQSMSYVIDVYRGQTNVEKNPIIYAAFVSFFPQLVAGPIERSSNLLPQIRNETFFDYDRAMEGLFLIMWGMFKKVAIADIAAKYVDQVYETPLSYQGIDIVLAIILFTIQIYCDFSGYTDMAIGSGKMLGISLMDNFDSPYLSNSVKEYWSRWHISLSTWFRDYIYIPLGGSRCSILKRDANLMITFLASGLWHGANWTFVVWGGLHGLAQVLENHITSYLHKKGRRKKQGGKESSVNIVLKALTWFTLFIFINLSWVPFRAGNLRDSLYVICNAFRFEDNNGGILLRQILDNKEIAILMLNIMLLSVFDYIQKCKINPIQEFRRMPLLVKIVIGYFIFADIMMVVFHGSGSNQFVYFQF